MTKIKVANFRYFKMCATRLFVSGNEYAAIVPGTARISVHWVRPDIGGFGITAFKFVNIDISSALDTVSISGTTLPQGLMGSIGFQIAW